MSDEIRRLLEKAFEAGHWAWPTPDHSTRATLRGAAIDRILAEVAASSENDESDLSEIAYHMTDVLAQRWNVDRCGTDQADDAAFVRAFLESRLREQGA